jgi:glycosyltransferase involved in cell wall biosynthesis
MRVVYLTAGAAGMYCGSCLRDNTLAAALRAVGRNVLLVPLYTPVRTDEPDASEACVLYGAVNVYLQHRSRLFRRLPGPLHRLLDSPGLLRRIRMSGRESPRRTGELTIGTLLGARGPHAREMARLVGWLRDHRPRLVNLPNAMFVHLARPIHDALGIPVVCTLTGEDIFIDAMPEPQRTRVLELIRAEAGEVDAFVATSHYYAEECRTRFGIAEARMHVIYPGIRVEPPPAVAADPARPFTVGYLARICPAKGLHHLVEAVAILRSRAHPVRLVVAGNLNPADRPYLADLQARAGWSSFEYLGEVDRAGKLAMLDSLDILSVPTVYREPKGLFALEAMSRGVPVVLPRHGAFPELVGATSGGILVTPDSPRELAAGLSGLLADRELREALGGQGRSAVLQSFTDRHMADRTWSLYEQLCGEAAVATA